MRLYEIKPAKNKGFTLYVDMDGVVSDFHSGISKLMGEPYSDERYETDKEYKKKMWDAIKEHKKKGGRPWYELSLLPDAMQLWTYIKQHNPTFLSATGTTGADSTEQEKRQWLDEKFGKNVPAIFVKAAGLKKEYAKSKNHILIDDKEKAINPWIKAGGIGILHTNASSTIQQLRKLGL